MITIQIKHEVPFEAKNTASGIYAGCATYHKDGRLVYIKSGAFYSDGRVSNFWCWQEIFEDGTLGNEESGYWRM